MNKPIAYDLNKILPYQVNYGLQVALENDFSNFGFFGCSFRDVIHGIPWSYEVRDFDVSNLEVYLGCCQFDKVFGRFVNHRDLKGHHGGLVLGVVSAELADETEKTGIKLLKLLSKKHGIGKLCVKNYVVQGYGNSFFPNDKLCLYITWKIDRRKKTHWVAPNVSERIQILNSLKEFRNDGNVSSENIKPRHFKSIVDGLHLKSLKTVPLWYKEHIL